MRKKEHETKYWKYAEKFWILENFQIYFLWSIILKNISALICKGIKDNGNKLLLFRTFYGTEWV